MTRRAPCEHRGAVGFGLEPGQSLDQSLDQSPGLATTLSSRRGLLAGLGATVLAGACEPQQAGTAISGAPPAPALASPPGLPVMATFSILADIVREVAGDTVRISTLVEADTDAHHFEPSPTQMAAIGRARLLVRNGLGFEGWMDRLVEAGSFSGRILTATDGVEPLYMRPGRPDPHAWQSWAAVSAMAATVARGLTTESPAAASLMAGRLADFQARAADGQARARAALAPVPVERRVVIVPHASFGYMGRELGIRFIPLGSLAPDRQPGAGRLARLVRGVRSSGAAALFADNVSGDSLLDQVARETGVPVAGRLYSDALSGPEGPAGTILALLAHNSQAIAAALVAAQDGG